MPESARRIAVLRRRGRARCPISPARRAARPAPRQPCAWTYAPRTIDVPSRAAARATRAPAPSIPARAAARASVARLEKHGGHRNVNRRDATQAREEQRREAEKAMTVVHRIKIVRA